MSLTGLYRSILFEALRQCPELVPLIFPVQWKQLQHDASVPGRLLSAADIERAFEALTTTGAFPSVRFCFFIDGLDEYHGQSLDHVRLAKRLQHWARDEDVKICASSRPYLEYENIANPANQTMHLHDLTRGDIYRFSRQMIENDDSFERIENSYLSLVHRVVEMSEGVFLWARLVVCSLLAGMQRHDTHETLLKKLKVLPRDLGELYSQLLDSLELDDRERAVKMLLLTAHNPFKQPLPVVMYSWIDNLADPQFPPEIGHAAISRSQAQDFSRSAWRQVKSLTKGLLETGYFDDHLDMHEVQFFHRRVRDFALENAAVKTIGSGFDVTDGTIYHRLLLATLAFLPTDEKEKRTGNVDWLAARRTSSSRRFLWNFFNGSGRPCRTRHAAPRATFPWLIRLQTSLSIIWQHSPASNSMSSETFGITQTCCMGIRRCIYCTLQLFVIRRTWLVFCLRWGHLQTTNSSATYGGATAAIWLPSGWL